MERGIRKILNFVKPYSFTKVRSLELDDNSLGQVLGNKASFNLKLEIHHVINPKRQTRVKTTIRVLTSRTLSNVLSSPSTTTLAGVTQCKGREACVIPALAAAKKTKRFADTKRDMQLRN